MTVFVVNRVTDNISAAERFGGLRFVSERYIYGDELDPSGQFLDWTLPAEFRSRLWAAARDFEPDFDYLLIAGDHLQLVAAVGLLTRLYGTFRVLRYDRKLSEYIPVRLDFRLDPDAPAVLTSPPNIGDTSGQDSDQDNTDEEAAIHRQAEALFIDGPHRPRKR